MAHSLSLTDSTTTLDLASTSTTGYHLVSLTPVPPNRVISRIGAAPHGNGERTVASGLSDVAVTIVLNIAGTSADDLDDRVQDLVRLLEQARLWEERKTGAPVRLAFKRQGVTNTAYRVVTGVPAMPMPVDFDEINWLDGSSIMNQMQVSLTVTLEPTWHAGALTSIAAATGKINKPSSNTTTASATTGDMPGSLYVKVKKTSAGVAWTSLAVAVCPAAPLFALGGGSADATSFSNSPTEITTTSTTGTDVSLGFSVDATIYNYPVRHLARFKVTAGTPGVFQARYSYKLGFDSGGSAPVVYGPWQTFPAAINVWWLFDLGTGLNLMQPIINRSAALGTGVVQGNIQVRSADGTSITVRMDYVEWVPYLGYVRMVPAALPQNYAVVYEAVRTVGSFVFPADPVTYQLTSGNALDTLSVASYGQLAPLHPGTTPIIWFAGQGASHDYTATADVNVSHLPGYALGLRGNA